MHTIDQTIFREITIAFPITTNQTLSAKISSMRVHVVAYSRVSMGEGESRSEGEREREREKEREWEQAFS